MADLKNPKVIWMKGILFLVLGILSATILLIQLASWQAAVLLGIAIWAFCRCYYFAFYVIEHYVDGEYRFAGLWSFVQYAVWGNRESDAATPGSSDDFSSNR